MRFLRSPLTGKPRSVRSSLPIRRKASENIRNLERDTPKPAIFIADSSALGNKAGMRRERDAKQHRGFAPLRSNPSRGIEWGQESLYGAFIASMGNVSAG